MRVECQIRRLANDKFSIEERSRFLVFTTPWKGVDLESTNNLRWKRGDKFYRDCITNSLHEAVEKAVSLGYERITLTGKITT